jgi:hypothetical protein
MIFKDDKAITGFPAEINANATEAVLMRTVFAGVQRIRGWVGGEEAYQRYLPEINAGVLTSEPENYAEARLVYAVSQGIAKLPLSVEWQTQYDYWHGIMTSVAKYYFNGVDSYATHSAWDTLGDFSVYGDISFLASGNQTDVVAALPPITEFGRVGANYHDGAITNVRYTDTSPMHGTTIKTSAVATFAPLNMSDGSFAFDYVHAANADIISGFLSVVAGVLTASGDATNLVVDGSAYAGAPLIVGSHYTIACDTTGGIFRTIATIAGIQNLRILT